MMILCTPTSPRRRRWQRARLAGDQWYNQRLVDVSNVAAAKGNPNFAFQIVSVFAPGPSVYTASTTSTCAATGTYRFNQVTVTTTAIPEPASIAALGVAGLLGLRRKRA